MHRNCSFQAGPKAVAINCNPTSVAPAIIMPLMPTTGRKRETVAV